MKYIVAGAGAFIGGQSTILAGLLNQETASIAYTGELLPAGTASYSGITIDDTKRYLKNSGKDKTPALVESGQGKFFNGTNQYIDTGIIPNASQGTIVCRFTATASTYRFACGVTQGGVSAYALGLDGNNKICARFGNAWTYISNPNETVSGRSYHVALRWVGTFAELIVDGVVVANFTAALNPQVTLPMFIGANTNSGSAANYYNNVINETYYYDVALTDAQIEALYKYPEKVKDYNGAIVPDIGNEDNCKLFLPMCENSGSNVVNVAVARGSDLAPTYTNYVGGGATAIVSGNDITFTATAATSQAYYPLVVYENVSIQPGSSVIVTFDITLLSGQMKFKRVDFKNSSNTVIASSQYLDISTSGNYGVVVKNSSSTETITKVVPFFDGLNYPIGSYKISNLKMQTVESYPLVNYTTAMHTSAAKLSYGAQCTAWKRDSFGVLLGMSNGLSFDGGVSTKGVSTGWTPVDTEPFVIESVVKVNNGVLNQMFGTAYLANSTTAVGFSAASLPQGAIANRYVTNGMASTIAHVVINWDGTVGQSKIYINGVEISYVKETSFVNPTTPFYIGSLGLIQKNIIAGTPKIYKGAEYAKFNIDKAWAKAQKTIAKLGA